MTKPLPPLNALRAFEVAARCKSVKKAAEELHVTPAAVSHQIQQLEDLLGTKLFRRRHRRIEMTEAAQVCFPKLHEGFLSLRQAVDRVRDYRSADVLTIGASPSFTSRWLMPRLHRFVIDHPAIDVRVGTRMRQFLGRARHQQGDLESVSEWVNEVDVVIVYGGGDYPGMQVEKLLPLSITPLCSPKLLRAKSSRKLTDLRQHQLLHDDRGVLYEGRPYWQTWLEAARVSGIDIDHGPHFTHSILAFEAAVEGLGVVASTPELVAADLAIGRLVAPFELRVPLTTSYHLVNNELAAKRGIVQTFRRWLLEEAALQIRTTAEGTKKRQRSHR
jgi:LysR family glycine cleavage system transcriptional activator